MQDEIKLVRARIEDANLLYKLQIETFMPLYEKYHEDSTSPAKETLESITRKITDPNSEFYIIFVEGEIAGGIRIRHHDGKIVWNNISWISPLFIISDFQNRGIAQKVMQKIFKQYPETTTWKLDTIKQEEGNCHLYEKCGFVRVGQERMINEHMTLVDYERTI